MADIPALNRKRARITELKRELSALEQEINRIENTCSHEWGPVIKGTTKEWVATVGRPIYHGSDIDYETSGYEQTVPSYTRDCARCGKSETTTKMKDTVTKVPAF